MAEIDFETGLDDASNYPECIICRKKSDSAVAIQYRGEVHTVCGTHYDELLRTDEPTDAFVQRLRQGKYAACWDTRRFDLEGQ